MSIFYYSVPTTDKSLTSVKSTVLAAGVSLLFLYFVHYGFHILATCVVSSQDEKQRNKNKQKLLQTSRVLYLFIICTIVSIYPPFYYGPHSAILSWFTLIILVMLHIFCITNASCRGRSAWSIFYMLYHILITVWILLVLIIGYTWSNQQGSAPDE